MELSRVERARDKVGDAVIAAAVIMRDSMTEVVMERVTRPKYGDAVDVAIGTLKNRIDALTAKPKATQKDAQIIDLLKEVKLEMETAFEERWSNRQGPHDG